MMTAVPDAPPQLPAAPFSRHLGPLAAGQTFELGCGPGTAVVLAGTTQGPADLRSGYQGALFRLYGLNSRTNTRCLLREQRGPTAQTLKNRVLLWWSGCTFDGFVCEIRHPGGDALVRPSLPTTLWALRSSGTMQSHDADNGLGCLVDVRQFGAGGVAGAHSGASRVRTVPLGGGRTLIAGAEATRTRLVLGWSAPQSAGDHYVVFDAETGGSGFAVQMQTVLHHTGEVWAEAAVGPNPAIMEEML